MRCCRRWRQRNSSVAVVESAIDAIVGEQSDSTALHVTMVEVLASLDAIQRELENPVYRSSGTKQVVGKVSPQALRVLSACGIREEKKGFSMRAQSSLEVLQAAIGIIRQLLLSLEEDSSAKAEATERQPVAPSAGSGGRSDVFYRHDDSAKAHDVSPEAETTDAEVSRLAGSPRSPEDGAEVPAEQLRSTTPFAEPKVVPFERFDAAKFRVTPAEVAGIERACAQRGETYVDPQFAPTAASLYLAAAEEHTWQCLICHAHSRLPPVPPLANSREEAAQQEQDFKTAVRCQGCGQPAHYVVQVRYFTRPTHWLRPGHACEGCQLIWSQLHNGNTLAATMCTHYLRDSVSQVLGTPWKVIREAARPEDVCQGALGNCWFAGALSVVAQMPDLISKICITKDVNPHGVYQLRLCHAGEWIDLVVDDYFPTSQVSEGFTDGQTIRFSRGGNLCYLGGARRQLWPPLVEKAAAKLFGCYGALKGGTFAEALALFTGYPTQRLRLYVPSAVRREKEEKRQARQEQRLRLLLGGADVGDQSDDTDDDEDDDLIWSKLLSCQEAGYLLGAGCSEEGCEKSRTHIVEEMGLQAPHAYGILDFAEVTVDGETARLVKIRNPWGQNAPRTWKGKWGKDWSGWTPELQKQLGVINSSGVLMDDPMSIFWMAFEDVKEYFGQVEICRVHHDWYEVRQQAWLPSGVGAGQAFDIMVDERSNVDVAFWQERHLLREGALGAHCTNLDVGLAVLRLRGSDGCDGFELVDAAPRSFDDCVSLEVILEAGFQYRILPISLAKLQDAAPRKGVLAVHSVKRARLTRIESSWKQVAAGLCHAIKKSGRSWSHPHCAGVKYRHQFEPGGCNFVVENSSPNPIAVQADAAESMGCSFSRGEKGIVVRIPPYSQRLVLALTFSPQAGFSSASIQPQMVPLDMAPEHDSCDVDDVHMPLLLDGSLSSHDDDLAQAIRLSLTSPQGNTAEARRLLDKRTKDIFANYRGQGMAPNEAASRAAREARQELGLV